MRTILASITVSAALFSLNAAADNTRAFEQTLLDRALPPVEIASKAQKQAPDRASLPYEKTQFDRQRPQHVTLPKRTGDSATAAVWGERFFNRYIR